MREQKRVKWRESVSKREGKGRESMIERARETLNEQREADD